MAERNTIKTWFIDFLNKLLPVVTGIAITFTLQGINNRAHERKAVQSAMELVRTELTSNLKDIGQLTDYLRQEVVSSKYLSDHKDDLASCPAEIVKYHQGQVNAYVSLVLSKNALELLKMSSLFPKVGDNDLSMKIIRAYEACELLQTDINRHYASRSATDGKRTPWLILNDMSEYTVDVKMAVEAIDTFLDKR
jgi:arginine utilization protein RocB